MRKLPASGRAAPVNEGRLPVLAIRIMVAAAAVALAMACSKWGAHSKGAVERGIQEHLNRNTQLLSHNFTTQVEKVTFNGDAADAVVKFQSTQQASLFVEVGYHLRLENGRWEVVSSTPLSGQGGDSHMAAPNSSSASPAGTQPAAPQLQPSH
ncbi:MAG TPA: hypothetical protein VMT20_00260 [Terriglobia bacterium]|nr:hypothetical protein [Terriglobia bacterium]